MRPGTRLLLLFILIALVYSPTFGAGFLSWDDDYNILQNPYLVIGPWWQLWWKPWYGMYIPVTSTMWAALFPLGAPAFRVFNLVLHLANTALVYGLLKRTRVAPTSLLAGTALFALHPLQVGAVAWISGSRDLLALFFALVAVIFFLRRRASVSALFFGLSLLSKPQLVALPAVMWLAKRDLRRLIPSFALASAVAVLTASIQSGVIEWSTPLWRRPLVMLDSYGFYLVKTIWPSHLSADYGRVPASVTLGWTALVATVVLSAALIFARTRREARLVLAWFILLLPVSGVVDFGYQQISGVADHYTYGAMVVVALLFSQGLDRLPERAGGALSLLVLGVFSFTSFQRAKVWANERIFFEDMSRSNPGSFSAHVALGTLDCIRGERFEDGLRRLQNARELRPDDANAAADMMTCLFRMGRHAEVLAMEAEIKRDSLCEHLESNDLAAADWLAAAGGAHFYKGDFEVALDRFCQAVWRNPMQPAFRNNVEVARNVLKTAGKGLQVCPPRHAL